MRKASIFVLVWCLIEWTEMAHSHDPTWQEKLQLGQEKMTQLHFYFHDTVSGKNPSAVRVAKASETDKSPTQFGVVMMADDPLTEGPEPSSKLKGRAQEVNGSAGQQELGLILAMSFVFMDEKYNGSTLSILGRNPALHPVREMKIVGGTGVFKMAHGIATAKTHLFKMTTGDAIVEYNVPVIHY